LPEAVLEEAASAVRACDLLLVLGTSAVVYPVAALPDLLSPGALLVEINPDDTPLTARAALAVRAPAGAFLAPFLA
jgi:NAD-dependent deacetylase